ncbi:hypothetical protein BHM03_00006096, partial [Ensete ventricosum]
EGEGTERASGNARFGCVPTPALLSVSERSCSLCRYCASPPPLVPADPLVKREMKYVLVTGGVVSGLGKGVTASSIGVVLKACGLRVTSIKIGICLPFLLKISSSFVVLF